MRKTSFLAILVALALAVPSIALAGSTAAKVRAVHASPDAPNVDILVNDSITLYSDVPFRGIGDYMTVPAELYNVKIVPTRGAPEDAVIDANVNLFYGSSTTIVALDEVANITPLVLSDDNSRVQWGKVRARFVHASPDAPAVDIKVVGGPIIFADVPFGAASDYMTFPAGTYDLEVRVAGTETVALTLPGIEFKGRSVYTIFAVDFLENLDVLLSRDAKFGYYDDESEDDDSSADDESDDNSSDDSDDDSSEHSFWNRFGWSRR